MGGDDSLAPRSQGQAKQCLGVGDQIIPLRSTAMPNAGQDCTREITLCSPLIGLIPKIEDSRYQR